LDFNKHREAKNLIPVEVENKEEYYFDLMNIENSFTGRADVMFSNDFFLECSQLIINAIALFEMGYFDCAFYSLRQSLEISTTIVYFVDDDKENRKKEIRKWRNEERFPLQSQMINQLQQRNKEFKEIKDKMNVYFEEIESIKRKLNKYVHKQGFDKFYTIRNNSFKRKFNPQDLNEDFEQAIIKCIGAVAVFRLAIDPMPLLLNDNEIYVRTPQLMTDPYSDKFLDKYIGEHHINSYKQTQLYQDHYEHFIRNEAMTPAVMHVVKENFIQRDKIDEIFKQKHLLSLHDIVSCILIAFSTKIAIVYSYGGFNFYFSNTKSVKEKSGFSSDDFKGFSESSRYNRPYHGAYLSYHKVESDDFFIEHNEEFNDGEIDFLNKLYTTHNKLNV